MGVKSKEHRAAVIAGTQQPFRTMKVKAYKFMTCGKCRHTLPEYLANEHLTTCQPEGTSCAKCKQIVPSATFMEHFNACKVSPPVFTGAQTTAKASQPGGVILSPSK